MIMAKALCRTTQFIFRWANNDNDEFLGKIEANEFIIILCEGTNEIYTYFEILTCDGIFRTDSCNKTEFFARRLKEIS